MNRGGRAVADDTADRLGPWFEGRGIAAAARTMWRCSHRRLTLRIAGREAPVQTPLLFVGNNRYQMGLLTLGTREAIDKGELCLYAPLARSPAQFLSISLRAVFGKEDE